MPLLLYTKEESVICALMVYLVGVLEKFSKPGNFIQPHAIKIGRLRLLLKPGNFLRYYLKQAPDILNLNTMLYLKLTLRGLFLISMFCSTPFCFAWKRCILK